MHIVLVYCRHVSEFLFGIEQTIERHERSIAALIDEAKLRERLPVDFSSISALSAVPIRLPVLSRSGDISAARRRCSGHGGFDPGSLSENGTKHEKDVTQSIALAIRNALAASGKTRVILTRSDDRFVPLAERSATARHAKAALRVSIHADSAPGTDATGRQGALRPI
jgi:hypothetical protein